MTPERLDLTRDDIIEMLKDKPNSKSKKEHVNQKIKDKKLNLSDAEMKKLLDDVDNY
jgi:hypothetical protein